MKNLFLTIIFALAVIPGTLAQSQTQLLCDNCGAAGQADTTAWIVMTIAG